MIYRDHEVRYRKEFILGTDFHLFQNVSACHPRHSTYHCLVLGCLHGMTQREHQRHLRLRTMLSLYPPNWPSHGDYLLDPPPAGGSQEPARECAYAFCISEETWQVIYTRVSLWRPPDRYQYHLHNIGCRVRSLLSGERRMRLMKEGTVVNNLLAPYPPTDKGVTASDARVV